VCTDAGSVPDVPTWADHVASILNTHCTSCHHPDGPAPFSLLHYEDARLTASLVAAAVRAGRMPPWLPARSDFAFAGERRLSAREIRVLERWAETGAQPGAGAADRAGETRAAHTWALGEPDLVLEMREPFMLAAVPSAGAAAEPAATAATAATPATAATVASETTSALPSSAETSPAHARDVFRNFVLPVPIDTLRWVRAVEFQPGDARVVHHLVMAVDTTRVSHEEDARDALPGFDGMLSRGGARPPGGFFVGWTPGSTARAQPAGFAWPLHPGSDLVLQMHLRPLAQPVGVRARVGLYFTDRPPSRTPLLIRLGGQTHDIPPGVSDYAVTDSFRLPADIEMVGVYPHAHYLGRTMHVRAVLPDGDERVILRIDDWDFNWQDAYAFERPAQLPAGTTIHLRYTYDNSAANPRNPARPPRRVIYGPASTDEMAELWIQAVPREAADLDTLQRALAGKSARDRVEGWEHLVRLNPRDATAHASLGAFHQAQGDLDRALAHYAQAVDAEPDYAAARYNLGLVLEARGELEQAERQYREALRVRPDHAGTHNNLGNVLLARGRLDEAARHFERAIALAPDQPEPLANYGRLLWQQGRRADALAQYRRAVEVRPAEPAARFNLMLALATNGEAAAARAQLDTIARLAPRAAEPWLALAWLWATDADPAVRRPADAVSSAQHGVRLASRADARALDVLAAAHAAAGNFDEAERLARQAHSLARNAGDESAAGRIVERLALYVQRRAYVQPSR